MKRVLLALALTCAPGAFAASCVNGTLQDYVNLGAAGCQAGAVTFSGFTGASGQSFATPISLSQIGVMPGGSNTMPSLQFNVASVAQANELFEAFFRFRAAGSGLTGSSISIVGSATGDGAATASEDVCAGGMFTGNSPSGCTKPSGTPIAIETSSFSMPSDSVSFAPASFFDIFVDLTADGGLDGSASLRSATARITAAASPVPEPASLFLFAAGFAVLAIRRSGKKA